MTYAIDADLLPWLETIPDGPLSNDEDLRQRREQTAERLSSRVRYEPRRALEVRDETVPGPEGAPPVGVRIYAPADRAGVRPGLLYLHGGGFVLGDVEIADDEVRSYVDELGIVVVSVSYRLAPEHPFPAPVEDCYAALGWLAANAAELGVDPARLGVAGESAGGGLAAAVALLARDRGGPALTFQYLGIPELDDRLDTPSMRAYVDTPTWNRPKAVYSWKSYLGGLRPGGDGVPSYAAPARATDLSGLPPSVVTVCQFDPLRDEGIAYAQGLMRAGVAVELRHYAGTFHGSRLIPDVAITKRMRADAVEDLRRGLSV